MRCNKCNEEIKEKDDCYRKIENFNAPIEKITYEHINCVNPELPYPARITSEELQKQTEHFINCICNDIYEADFCERMARSHRTLQQSYTKFALKWIKKEAEQEYFDARNERAVLLSRKIMELVKDEINLPMI
jgi:S-methylmethionine-dependent homocysteine/selenocysteine methylase